MTNLEKAALAAGWERLDDGVHEVTWRRPVRPREPYVKNRTEWVVGSAEEALEIDLPSVGR